jgi:hypothetical protein
VESHSVQLRLETSAKNPAVAGLIAQGSSVDKSVKLIDSL